MTHEDDSGPRDAAERHHHARMFGLQRGWRLSRSDFPVLALHTGTRSVKFELHRCQWFDDEGDGVLHHADYFTDSRRPVAIVTHSFNGFGDVRAWAARRGLNATQLPDWYWPGTAVTVLLTSNGLLSRWAAP